MVIQSMWIVREYSKHKPNERTGTLLYRVEFKYSSDVWTEPEETTQEKLENILMFFYNIDILFNSMKRKKHEV